MSPNTTTLADLWFREKHEALWAAMQRRDFQSAIEIAVMVETFHPDPTDDLKEASYGRAQMFETLAALWSGTQEDAKGRQFAQRALAIRRHLAEEQMRTGDQELKLMIDYPIDVAGPAFAREGFLPEVARQVVAGLWQSQGLPRQLVHLEVDLNLPWRLALRHKGLGFLFINLESVETDADGRGALALFCALATFEGEGGPSNKQVTLFRGVLRVPVQSAVPGNEEKVRVGWVVRPLPQGTIA
jgi:hypothetical protein